MWPTPRQGKTTDEDEETWMKRKNRGDVSTPPLTLAVKMWRSPSANEPGITPERLEPIEGGELGGMNRHFDKHTGRMAQIGLTQQVALRQWPTPTGTERSGINPNTGKGEGLSKAVKNIPTPQSATSIGPRFLDGGKHARQKLRDQFGDDEGRAMACGQLNPDWVEWLMGWPIGWTSMEPLTEIVWLSWKIDPADMEESDYWPTAHTKDGTIGAVEDGSKIVETGGLPRRLSGGKDGYALTLPRAVNYRKHLAVGPLPRVATGIKDRVNRLKALGNGQVSLCAATAFRILAGQ